MKKCKGLTFIHKYGIIDKDDMDFWKEVRGLTGTIFDIQHFSVHDGPGIRTTVFMKGCPLRCKWCHNPEGLSKSLQLRFFEDKCIGCGLCGERKELLDAQRCPSEALTICGREVDEDEVIDEVLKDTIFYSDNGGITFSGGECLLQADFVASVLRKAKAVGLHTAIDTCGYVPFEAFEKTLAYCDLYLYDVKCFTSALHTAYTGVDNFLIMNNLNRLAEVQKDIWIRIPVIPGFNNDIEEMTQIAELISSMASVKQLTLMPYHTLGASKYKTLGFEYPFDTDKRISERELVLLKNVFSTRNITVV